MGWGVGGGRRQTFVVCRYEEDPAREVSSYINAQIFKTRSGKMSFADSKKIAFPT